MRTGKTILRSGLRTLVGLLVFTAVVLYFFTVLRNMDVGQTREGRRQLELSLRRAAVACYAERGAYPPTLEELTQYSGVQIDPARYRVFYEVFADNLMPNITVLVNEP